MSHKVLRYINFLLFSLIKIPRVDFSAFGMSFFVVEKSDKMHDDIKMRRFCVK
jgi:hypothetical protein